MFLVKYVTTCGVTMRYYDPGEISPKINCVLLINYQDMAISKHSRRSSLRAFGVNFRTWPYHIPISYNYLDVGNCLSDRYGQ